MEQTQYRGLRNKTITECKRVEGDSGTVLVRKTTVIVEQVTFELIVMPHAVCSHSTDSVINTCSCSYEVMSTCDDVLTRSWSYQSTCDDDTCVSDGNSNIINVLEYICEVVTQQVTPELVIAPHVQLTQSIDVNHDINSFTCSYDESTYNDVLTRSYFCSYEFTDTRDDLTHSYSYESTLSDESNDTLTRSYNFYSYHGSHGSIYSNINKVLDYIHGMIRTAQQSTLELITTNTRQKSVIGEIFTKFLIYLCKVFLKAIDDEAANLDAERHKQYITVTSELNDCKDILNIIKDKFCSGYTDAEWKDDFLRYVLVHILLTNASKMADSIRNIWQPFWNRWSTKNTSIFLLIYMGIAWVVERIKNMF